MKRLAFLGLLLTTASHAEIVEIRLEPSRPIAGEAFDVVVSGELGDHCWKLTGSTCGGFTDGTAVIDCELLDTREPGEGCGLTIFEYDVTCSYDGLAAGTYVVTGVERRDSMEFGGEHSLTLEFTIADATPTVERTWAQIKSLFGKR